MRGGEFWNNIVVGDVVVVAVVDMFGVGGVAVDVVVDNVSVDIVDDVKWNVESDVCLVEFLISAGSEFDDFVVISCVVKFEVICVEFVVGVERSVEFVVEAVVVVAMIDEACRRVMKATKNNLRLILICMLLLQSITY